MKARPVSSARQRAIFTCMSSSGTTRYSPATAPTCTVKYPSVLPLPPLGRDIEIPTLDGKVKLRIPQETQSGKLFRLRGKGVRSVRSSARGDLLCRVMVETPVNLSRKQKDILESFEDSMVDDEPRFRPPRQQLVRQREKIL